MRDNLEVFNPLKTKEKYIYIYNTCISTQIGSRMQWMKFKFRVRTRMVAMR
jgi:hypothetical protein